jgi:hypothetical protein
MHRFAVDFYVVSVPERATSSRVFEAVDGMSCSYIARGERGIIRTMLFVFVCCSRCSERDYEWNGLASKDSCSSKDDLVCADARVLLLCLDARIVGERVRWREKVERGTTLSE